MIYIKNNNEVQTIFIPRNELQKEAFVASVKSYEDGLKEGFNNGIEYQKDQLLNLYVTENGQYEREDGWGVVTVDIPIGDCPDCPEGGSCNLGEGEVYLTVDDAGFYELLASDDGYDGWSKFYITLENSGAIKVHKASDLLDTFNNGENIDYGAYYYVGGQITDIQEISMQYGNATYTLDNGFSVYRGKWIDGSLFGEDQIKVGAYIVVYGIIQEHNGVLGFKVNSQVIAYQECEGGEIVSCNIQDYKWVRPSMADRADNGDIYIYPDEGYDAVGYIDFDPNDIYNEGYNEGVIVGKAESGGLNLGEGYIGLTENERGQMFELIPSNDGYDAYSKVTVELHNFDLGGDINIYDAWTASDGVLYNGLEGKEIYVKGTVTDIQRMRPEYGDARYTIDGIFGVYNGQYNADGLGLAIGDWVIVKGTTQNYNGQAQFVAGSEIIEKRRCEGSGNCDDAFNEGFDNGYTTGVQDGYNQGYYDGQANCGGGEGGSCNLINPIIFSETEGNTINAGGVDIPTFVYEGNQHYNVWSLNMADYEEFKIQIRFQPTNGGYGEPVNIFGCEDTDWDNTTFGARIYEGDIYFRMSGMDVLYPYFEWDWYEVEMGYNSSKRWIIVNGETLLETDHAWFTKPSQTFMIGAINSGGNAFRPFYGKIAAAYVQPNGSQVWLLPKEEGQMGVYWNDRGFPWVSLNGESNARFEIDWMSGDGMKSITWLGNRVSCPSVQEQMNEYYYNPIIVSDSGFGERAKEFSVLDETMISNDEGILYGDKYVYIPSSNNKNEIRTKINVDRMSFPFEESDSMYMGQIWIEHGVGVINFNGLYFNNLYYFETSVSCGEIKLTNCTLNNLNTLVIKASGTISYDFRGTIFKDGGVLRVNANLTNAEAIRAALGSGWTIEYL